MDRKAVQQQVLVVSRFSSAVYDSYSTVFSCPHWLVPKGWELQVTCSWAPHHLSQHKWFHETLLGRAELKLRLVEPINAIFATEENCYNNPCGKLNKLPVILQLVFLDFLMLSQVWVIWKF